MINIESRKNLYNIVISDLSRCRNNYMVLLDFLSQNGIMYYAIVHDHDINRTTGQAVNKHLHIVTRSIKRYRVKQMFNLIADCLLTNIENIQIADVDNFNACVQYLIHKNDLSKYQYSVEDIITNDCDNLIPILNETIRVEGVTTDKLIELIKGGASTLELIKAIGIGSYTHYRQTIKDLYQIFYDK